MTIKNCANTGFVNIILEKRFYMRVEKIAEDLGTKPDMIINNILLDISESWQKPTICQHLLRRARWVFMVKTGFSFYMDKKNADRLKICIL